MVGTTLFGRVERGLLKYGKIAVIVVIILGILGGNSLVLAEEKGEEAGFDYSGITSYDMRNLFIYESGQWLWKEGLAQLAGSNEESTMNLVFDPTEDVEMPLRTTLRRIVSSYLVENGEFNPDEFLGYFEDWISQMYDLSLQISADHNCMIVSTELYEDLNSGKCQFIALSEEYVSGELVGETQYTDATGENNEARFEWEILPIQIADENGIPCAGEVYLFYRITEAYADGYCLSQTWLIADQGLVNRLLLKMRESISTNGNEHSKLILKIKQ